MPNPSEIMRAEEARFITKDSGARQEFTTGSRRDTQTDKSRYDLIPVCALRRLADLYSRGAKKYGENNWEKGQPLGRTYASLLRHVYAWREGDRTEDHLAAVAWNAFSLIFYEEQITQGQLPEELNDLSIPLACSVRGNLP